MTKPTSFIGPNVIAWNLGHAQREEAIQYWKQVNPRAAVIFDGDGHYAARFARELPDTLVIFRPVLEGDQDNLHNRFNARAYIDAYAHWVKAAPNMALYCENEPVVHAGSVAWLVECSNRAHEVGIQVVLGNYSTGVPEKEQIPEYFHTLLRLIIQRGQILGLHEYWWKDVTRDHFFIGRFRYWYNWCDLEFGKRPLVVITEFQGDGRERGGGPFEHMGKSDDWAYEQSNNAWLWHYEAFPEIIGACWFSYHGAGGWEVFDMSDNPRLKQLFIEKPIGVKTHMPINERWYFLSNIRTLNFRAQPTTSGKIMGRVNDGDRVQRLTSGHSADGYAWEKIKLESGEEGYIAVSGPGISVAFREVGAQPEPECEREAALEGALRQIRRRIETMESGYLGEIAAIYNLIENTLDKEE